MFGMGRNRKAFAGVYALGGQVIVFPQHGISVACDLATEVALRDAQAMGIAVQGALEASTPLRSKKLTLGEQTRAFEDRMEAFRLALGLGKVVFMRDLAHVSVMQTPEGITLSGMRPVRGRFAFEGGGPQQVVTPPSSDDPRAIGRALAEVLG